MVLSQRERTFAWAAAFSGAAAVVHGAAVDEHLREWWGYGIFFLFAAVAQMFYAVLLLTRPWRRTPPKADDESLERQALGAGIVGNAFLVVLYVWTRTVGIPGLGPGAGVVEPVSPAGILAKACEVALIVTLVRLLRGMPDVPAATPSEEARV